MKKKLFGNSISPSCHYCEFYKIDQQAQTGVCSQKKRDAGSDYSCKRFCYDPLKRIPKPLPKLQKFNKSDFEL